MKLSILTDLFDACLWWQLLWMLLAFLLGWLLRKWLSKGGEGDCCDELTGLRKKYANLESKYNMALSKKERIETVSPNINSFTDTSSKSSLSTSHSGTTKKTNSFSKLKKNNLQIVEGIGPKMDEVLKKYGVGTWAELSLKSFDELRAILDEENPTRYKIINPETWAKQAKLATEGKWDELIALQKDLDGGKTTTSGSSDSKLEKIMIKLGLIRRWKQDDLKAVEGIGPKIAKLFNENGITTWKALSETSIEKMNAILEKGGDRFKLANPGTWAQQAKLAFEGKWDELQALQDELNGGK